MCLKKIIFYPSGPFDKTVILKCPVENPVLKFYTCFELTTNNICYVILESFKYNVLVHNTLTLPSKFYVHIFNYFFCMILCSVADLQINVREA